MELSTNQEWLSGTWGMALLLTGKESGREEKKSATLDPENGEVRVYRNGVFELSEPWNNTIPEVRTSADWYLGKREHLQVARITGVAQVA